MKHYSVNIPTKPHLYKYVAHREGSPVFMNSDSSFCIMLRCCLGRSILSGLDNQEIEGRIKTMTSTIQVMLPMTNMRIYGFEISDHQIIMINRFLENDFETELLRHCKYYIEKSGRYVGFKFAYESFAEKHNIILEEDIPYDTLKKIEYRARKKYEKICFGNVPSLFNS